MFDLHNLLQHLFADLIQKIFIKLLLNPRRSLQVSRHASLVNECLNHIQGDPLL